MFLLQAFGQNTTNSPAGLISIATHHYDNARTGQNTNETVLTPANVNTNSFGRLFTCPVDGHVYAQPLYVPGLTINQTPHNTVFVATEHNSVYAFDADGGALLWRNSMGNPAPQDFHGGIGIDDAVGITGTPVIDPNSGTLYLDSFTVDTVYHHRVHALSILDGTERNGSPVEVTASVPGTGDASVAGTVTFDPSQQLQRPALTLANGVIYVCFGSYADNNPYHGWIIGFDASSLQQLFVFNTTPNGSEGAIWQSGAGLAVDGNTNLYFETANGTFDADGPFGTEYGDSFVKLSAVGGLSVVDFFTPFDQGWLDENDIDLGSCGPVLLPDSVGSAAHPHLLVGCGKEGTIYLLDRDNLGHYNWSNDNQIVQVLPNIMGGMWSSPAYFNNLLYFQGNNDSLKCFQITNGSLSASPISQTVTTVGYPPGTPVVSANGTNNAIVWLIQTDSYPVGQAILHAYNAYDLTQEFYNSRMTGTQDNPGAPIKFSVPAVANGKVYVGAQYALSVFGNLTVSPTIVPSGGVFTNAVLVTLSDPTPGASIYYTLDNSTPTTNSILYTGPFTLSNSLTVIAKAFTPGAADSSATSATFLSSVAIGQGIGLTGAYYSNQNKTFVDPPNLVRIDPTINFNWDGTAPDSNISQADFTVRWAGSLLPQFNETYTFYATASDGVRLWVNDQLIIDGWLDQPPTAWSGSVPLVAGQTYNLEMDYYEDQGQAVASLSWSSPSTPKAIIPQTQLFPTNQPPPSLSFSTPTNGAIFLTSDNIILTAAAAEDGGIILSVDFYSNGSLLGSLSNSPYALRLSGLPVGTYALSALATDAAGVTTTSSVVNVFVVSAPSPAQLAISPAMLNFGFMAVGSAAQASFLVTNLGTAPISNAAAVLDGGPFTILSGTPFNLGGFGSTNIAVQFDPTTVGTFSNSVTITTDNAGASTNLVTGTAAVPPVASFFPSLTSGVAPLTITFTDFSIGTIANHFWDFGDGSTTNIVGTNVTHIYTAVGTNTVSLTVSGPLGSSTQVVQIMVTNPPPLLLLEPKSLRFGPVTIGQTNTLEFQMVNGGGQPLMGSAATAAPFSIIGGSPFNIGVGQTGLVSIAFAPTTPLSFTGAVMFASNAGNSTNTLTGIGLTPAQLEVSPWFLALGYTAIGNAIQGAFMVTNLGSAPMNNGVATLDNGPFSILSGSPFNLPGFGSTNIVVEFSQTSEGTFTNQLTIVTDNGGNSTNLVTASSAVPPSASFFGTPTSGVAPLAVNFTDNSSGTITNRLWDWGDGVTSNSTATTILHTYNIAGTNAVGLTVSGPLGTNLVSIPAYIVVTNLGPVTISVSYFANQVQLVWSNGTLQSSTSPTGPYSDMTNAVSPYTVSAGFGTQFFRVRVR